jgi:hypothetical protein
MNIRSVFATIGILTLAATSLTAQVQITEFMASNQQTLKDDYGDYSDWIEIWNSSTNTVNLSGWALTDSAKKMSEWLFPSTNMAPDSYMVIFASGRDRRIPGAALHTNFKLDASGEYLALVRPDGTVATQFSAKYPAQIADVSYGFGLDNLTNLLIGTNSTGRVLVPTSQSWNANWTLPDFADASWRAATNGIGFETGFSEDPASVSAEVLAANPPGYWRLGETNTTTATNSGWILGSGDGAYVSNPTNGVPGPQAPTFAGFESNNLATRFNGSGAKIEIPFTGDLNPSGPFTVEAWVKPSKTNYTGCVVASIYVSGSSRAGFAFYQNYTTAAPGQWDFCLGNASGYIAHARGGTFDTNHWTYLVGVYDGSKALLYTNGVLAGSSNLTSTYAPNTSQKFVIGGRIDAQNPYYFSGDIDEVSLIASALSAANVSNRFRTATQAINRTNVFNYTSFIRTDLRSTMYGSNSTACLRLPFNLTNTTAFNRLSLRVRYDDGFAAYLNGALVASDNAPATLAWNSAATNQRPVTSATAWRSIDLTSALGYLRPGTNILALQGLNLNATNTDFLLQTELEARQYAYSTEPRYFISPTPGAANSPGTRDLGPLFTAQGFSPAIPGTNDCLTITTRLVQALAPVTNVTLNWRVMYNTLQTAPMYDDGLHGDGAAGDGIYGAIITNLVGTNWTYTAGQMVRWYITSTDSLSNSSRWPLFTDSLTTAEYAGTVIQPDYVSSALPIFHLFVDPSNISAMDSESGSRASFYYDGEFYDNIYIELRGNTTAGFAKKSHRVEFNDEHQLRHPGPGGRVGKTSLMAEYMDPCYLRQHLSYWLQDLAGVPCAFDYPVRVQRNGSFYQLAFHNDVLGAEQLDRMGYDREGALYKAAGIINTAHYSTGGFTKQLPKTNLTSTADFDAMATAISSSLTTAQRKTNLFDILNVPEVVDYLAVARWTQEGDDVWANMTLYRDTFGSGEWSVIPFDLNLSWGQLYYGDMSSVYGQITATNDYYKSHPLYGGSQVQQAGGSKWNSLYDVIIAVPETRQMLLRRIRTLMDRFIQPPGISPSQGLFEQHIFSLTNQIWAEAFLDRQQWGWPPNGGAYGWGTGLWLTNGTTDLLNQYLTPRRNHFFSTHCVTNTSRSVGLTWSDSAGIPDTQPTNAVISIIGVDYNPASGNQDQEYICLTNANSFAVDLTGWRLGGAVSHKFTPGTVIPSNSALYLSPNVAAFRSRTSAPRGGLGLFVQGNYNGHLSAWGEALGLTNADGRLVSSASYTGNPSAAQRYLRITEIMYNPSPATNLNSDAQAFEYLELKNISPSATLDLNGVALSNGVTFNFTGSAVTSLAPGATVLLVANSNAFTARYGSGFRIAGEYAGALNNSGETLRLQDSVGEKILEFDYDNKWHPLTDGLGFSLVIVNENASWDTWGLASSWRASGKLNGSPGTDDPTPPQFAPVRINEALTHSDPDSDWIELYNPAATNADIGGWFLTDSFYSPKRYRIPTGTTIPAHGYLVFPGSTTFETGTDPFALSEYGEQVFLLSGDASTNLTGYSHGFDFGAAPNSVTFGRYLTSQGEEHFVLQSAPTPGASNALPRVGPVVVSEIHYHPTDLAGGTNNSLDEFIELQNITASAVPLYCAYTNESGYGLAAVSNTWRLRSAVDYDFPTNTILAASSRILVVSFNPATNTAQLASFRSLYGISNSVPVFGPWSGNLDNSGESVRLLSPDKPDVTTTNITIPYVVIDQVDYLPDTPWPTNADGQGGSLQRIVPGAYGNDPTNWAALLPAPGRLKSCIPHPVLVASRTNAASAALSAWVASGLTYQLEFKTNLTDAKWIPAGPAVAATNSPVNLLDTNPAAARRFYRLVGQ